MLFSHYFLTGLATSASLAAASATIHKRSYVDTCAEINMNLVVSDEDYGHIKSCICLGTLSTFLTTNSDAEAAVAGAGVVATTVVLTEAINEKHSVACTFPDNSTPSCEKDCAYTCNIGYVAHNGGCVQSASPNAKRAYNPNQVCGFGFTKCGAFNQRPDQNGFGFECINTKTNLESCGGCTTAFGRERAIGVDCTAIPGVSGVECEEGVCVVTECKAGWKLVGSSGCEPA